MKSSISERGYGIPFSEITEKEVEEIKDELTVEPKQNQQYCTTNSNNKFILYKQSSQKLYVPKFYGIKKYGLPAIDKFLEPHKIDVQFKGELRSEQKIPCMNFLKSPNKGGIINVGCGGGKCLAKNTLIIMHDGIEKKVQDIKVHDRLMGDDGTVRNVYSTINGKDMMYKIIPLSESYFEFYIVNSAHILSLKTQESERYIDIHILDYLSLNDETRQNLRGYTYSFNYYNQNVLELEKELHNICDTFDKNNYYICNYNTKLIKKLKSYGHDVKTTNSHVIVSRSRKVQHTYEFKVEKFMIDDYYGFEIDGNRRFLLGDCTVTHNTVMGLYCISELKLKTMIIMHKEFLINQWKERIEEFLPNAKVGLIKAKHKDVENKDIILASLQSLSMKSYESDVFQGIGFVIVDEVHRTGTEVFSKALLNVSFMYSLGLSATVQRNDGLTKVFTWFIGDILYKKQKESNDVNVKLLDYKHDKDQDIPVLFNGKVNWSKLINNITENKSRSSFVVEQILKICEPEAQRKILILSDRINQLKDFAFELDNKFANISYGYYIGGMKENMLKESETKQIILATFAFASEGFDVKNLDTLVLASPKSNIEQSVGRILRQKKEFRTNIPLVIDIQDDICVIKNQNQKRKQFYKKCGYKFI